VAFQYMRTIAKRILSPILQKASALWMKKPRRYIYKDISVWVEPGVFPPFLTFSTKLLLDFIDEIPLKGKTFLELGCGCGIISILAAKKDAVVTASDINTIALEALQKNAAANQVSVDIVYSDLFENLQKKSFDVIVINPPYYPKAPKSLEEQAWFCGEDFEYFAMLFGQLKAFLTFENKTFMILSEDCQVDKIKAIALRNFITFDLISERKVAAERNFIFGLASL
jgi:release factor glutamine methyltransferase